MRLKTLFSSRNITLLWWENMFWMFAFACSSHSVYCCYNIVPTSWQLILKAVYKQTKSWSLIITDTAGDFFPINVFLFLPNVSQSTGYQMKPFQTSFKIKKKVQTTRSTEETQRKHGWSSRAYCSGSVWKDLGEWKIKLIC